MNNLTDEEKEAISIWTSPLKEYRAIKSIINGTYNGPRKEKYKVYAKLLIGLFNKDDNTNNNVIYRGDILENKTSTAMTPIEIYNSYLRENEVGNKLIIDKSIISFSIYEDIAKKSYMDSEKNINNSTPSIMYVVTKRKSTFIDISSYSCIENEGEILCNAGIEFIISDIEQHPNNHLVYYLYEL